MASKRDFGNWLLTCQTLKPSLIIFVNSIERQKVYSFNLWDQAEMEIIHSQIIQIEIRFISKYTL